MELQPPREIAESLEEFRQDHPNPRTVGFVMTRFARELDPIVDVIRLALSSHGFKAVLAKDRWYKDDLLPNVKTYIWGSGFGIAVFDKDISQEFNPNVAFELGFMIALQKPVLILVDKALSQLYADIHGRLYEPFELIDAPTSIPMAINRFLGDKKLLATV